MADASDVDAVVPHEPRRGPLEIVQIVSIVLDSRFAWYLVTRDIAGSREQCFVSSLRGIMADFDQQVRHVQIKHLYTLDGRPLDKSRYFGSAASKKERSHKMHAYACTAYAMLTGLLRRKDPEFFRTPFFQRCNAALMRVAMSALDNERRFLAQRRAIAPMTPLPAPPPPRMVDDDIDAAIESAMNELEATGVLKRPTDGGGEPAAKRARVEHS
eukprot:Opistho-1_new@67427